MYSRVTIKNFRGIRALEVEGLRHINLIVGRNNSGKTTFLEALFLLGGAPDAYLPAVVGQLRGQRPADPDPIWRPLFHNLDSAVAAQVSGQWNGERGERQLMIEAVAEPRRVGQSRSSSGDEGAVASTSQDLAIHTLLVHSLDTGGNRTTNQASFDHKAGSIMAGGRARTDFARTTFLSARSLPNPVRDAQQFSSLLKTKHDKDVVDALRIIEPRVDRVEVVSEPGSPSIYLDIGLDALVPLAVCGEGMVRLFSIIVELISSRGGVLLIDEIENGLHYTVIPHLWRTLAQAVEKHKVQVFATTHNDDVLRSALEAFAGTPGVLGLFRIDRRDDRHVMVQYDDEAMEAVREVPFEVRG
jgi:hypothetical protein